MERIFRRSDILLPRGEDWMRWSVVACDQYTSDPAYWDRLSAEIGDAPSTLRMILPEAFLDRTKADAAATQIHAVMTRYLAEARFRTLPMSYVYVERRLRSGALRRGLVGALDLEAYDYRPDSTSPVRATEGTVESRLPPRVRIRRDAPLELPHIMVFLDDPADRVIGAAGAAAASDPLYDFDLLADGGHLRGWQVCGGRADAVDAAVDQLVLEAEASAGARSPLVFAMGDGNHSLAAAKACWEERKQRLPAALRAGDPARWALVELVNIHDPSIRFEPIHRVVRTEDPGAFLREAHEVFSDRYCPDGVGYPVLFAGPGESVWHSLSAESAGDLIGDVDRFLAGAIALRGGSLDYIHNDETALALAADGCFSVLLPPIRKEELFPSILRSGPFPRKSFSIGRAEDKRYYLECRAIR